MKKIISIMIVMLMTITMAACTAKTEVKDGTAWDALFSGKNMENVTVTVDVGDETLVFERDNSKLHISYGPEMEYFAEEVDGVVTYYFIDGEDVVGESAGTSTSVEEIFAQEAILDTFQGIFDELEYDAKTGVYVEKREDFNNTYKVSGGRIEEIVIDPDDLAYTIGFSDYDKTKVTIPEMTVSYSSDDGSSDVSDEEWNAAFTPENFSNVTVEHYYEYADGSTYYSVMKYADQDFEFDEETEDGEYNINFFYHNDDGTYSFINNSGSGTLEKKEVEDVFLSDVVKTQTLGIPSLRSLYSYDPEYGGWIYATDDEVTFVGFAEGRLAVIMLGNGEDVYQVYFSNYGSTVVGEFSE